MDKYKILVDAIAKKTGKVFAPASDSELAQLEALGLPEAAVDFYRRHAPASCIAGQIRIWPIEDVVVENTQAVPGVGVQPHGYVVFASTFGGDAYCFDANRLDSAGDPEIVLVSHETVGEDATREQVAKSVKVVAPSLLVFLEQFLRDEIDEECIY